MFTLHLISIDVDEYVNQYDRKSIERMNMQRDKELKKDWA